MYIIHHKRNSTGDKLPTFLGYIYKIIKLLFCLLFCIQTFFSLKAQPNDSLMMGHVTHLDSLAKNSRQEQIYLQTSKDVYEAGEDLWFKAYILNSQFFIPSPLSQTLYLQVVNKETGTAVWQEKYEVITGFADGHVFLQDTLSEGDYFLETFTGRSFINDLAEFKSVRKITVKKDMNPRPSFKATFNKFFFNPGDTIKMTATSLSENNEPLYAVFNATLYSNDKELTQKHAVTNAEGRANLEFIAEGSSNKLRIVTRIKYADKEETKTFAVPCKKGSPVQFNTFPEGGNLVAGLPCKMAFKAVNIDGEPLNVTGTLFEDDTSLLDFKSVHAGMGSFDFTPEAGKKYHIHLSEPITDSTFFLPEIYKEGLTLQLAGKDKEYLSFLVLQNDGMAERTVFLRGQMRGTVFYMASGKLNGELEVNVPLTDFPQQGIAEFTLFDSSLSPLAERLVCIQSDKKLYIETTLDKEKYETRGKATLKIKTTDETGNPVVANLGVSVFDKLYLNTENPGNILSHYYLSEQILGRIYDPVYYFNKKNDDREEALDLLLLTQGWRRYVWNEENLKENTHNVLPVVADGTLGEVHYTKKLKQAPKGQQLVMAFNPLENNQKKIVAPDVDGRFVLTPEYLKIVQGAYIYLKPMGQEDFEPRITLDNPFRNIEDAMKHKTISYPLLNIGDTANINKYRPFIIGPNVIELGEVTVKGRGIKPFRDKYMGNLDSLANAEFCTDYVGVCGILNCPIHKGNTNNTKPVEGKTYHQYIGFQWVNDVGGAYRTDGEINVEYHYPRWSEEGLMKKFNLYRVKAYYRKQEFYQPNYDKEEENGFLPDTRNTLLWVPTVITDKNGEANLEFFCSDLNTEFIGKIEGLGNGGLLGADTFEFKVLKTKRYKWEK